jgi:hypothetical protein
MKAVRLSILAGLIVLLAAGDQAGTVRGAKPSSLKARAFRGTIAKVQRAEGKSGAHHGIITVQHRIGKGKNSGQTAYDERMFRVTAGTKLKEVSAGKGQKEASKATLEDVHRGQHVTVYHRGGHALEVILHRKKQNKQ